MDLKMFPSLNHERRVIVKIKKPGPRPLPGNRIRALRPVPGPLQPIAGGRNPCFDEAPYDKVSPSQGIDP